MTRAIAAAVGVPTLAALGATLINLAGLRWLRRRQ